MGIIITLGKAKVHRLFEGGIFPTCGIISADSVTEINCANSVVIAGKCADTSAIHKAAALITNSDDATEHHCEAEIPVITCGMGSKNTVSVTSITMERITLSLNRSLQTLNGICQPLEQSFPFTEDISCYDYMAAFAACIALGKIT